MRIIVVRITQIGEKATIGGRRMISALLTVLKFYCKYRLNLSSTTRCTACPACFFFFQAEDGIRDLTVTGVQTCALPISMPRRPIPLTQVRRQRPSLRILIAAAVLIFALFSSLAAWNMSLQTQIAALQGQRSEERRVGKECRSRWSPYH